MAETEKIQKNNGSDLRGVIAGVEEGKKGSRSLSLKSELGHTSIGPGVIAKIAGLAIREVEGVHDLVPYSTGQAIEGLARTIGRKPFRALGVNVEVGEVECAVDCRIVIDYGYPIQRVAAGIRKNCAERLQEMTGLVVKEVNIEVVDLFFADGKEQDEATPEPTSRVR